MTTKTKKKRFRQSPISFEQVRDYFKERDCTLLEKTYTNNKQVLRYKCKCGNIRFTTWNTFTRFGCKICYLKKFEKSKALRMVPVAMREGLFDMTEVAKILGVHYRIEKFRARGDRFPRLKHYGWWVLHNFGAHGMLAAYPCKFTFGFHDWTSIRLNAGIESLREFNEKKAKTNV